MRKVSAPKVQESGVLKACLDLLAAEDIWHLRMNTGAMKVGKRFTRFGRPGTADILAFPLVMLKCAATEAPSGSYYAHGIIEPLWIECKSSDGIQSDAQKEFEQEVKDNLHRYLLVRDVDTLRDFLKEKGVTR